MARRNARRRKRGRSPAFVFLILAAIVAGALLYPLQHAPRPRSAALPEKTATPQPRPHASAAPALSSPSATPETRETPVTPVTPEPPASPTHGRHRLAIIIDDCGQWPDTERALIALPIPLTMSVMPKERYTQSIARAAADAGKGVMLHLPMEPRSGANPGAGKITTAMSDAAIEAQVKEDLALVPLAKGVNNHEGSKASADARVMNDVVSILAPANLFFVDSRTSAQTVGAQVAAAAGMRTASRDVFLDDVDERGAVESKLREAAADAEKNGSAVAIGHPRRATLEAISALIPDLEARGITFVLVSELVR